MDPRSVGTVFEQFTAEQMKLDGYKITARNFMCRYGEIDIIALKGNVLCFVEVKARAEKNPFTPEEAVTHKKLEHITACAAEYIKMLKKNSVEMDFFDISFDMAAISYDERVVKEYNYYKGFCTVDLNDLRGLTL